MAHGIALVRVHHQLGQRRGAGGEVKQERIGGVGRAVGRELRRLIVGLLVRDPSLGLAIDDDAGVIAGNTGKTIDRSGSGDDVASVAALEPVAQVFHGEKRRGGNDDGSQLHGRQHDLPDGDHVGQHDHQAVAAADATLAQEVGYLVGTSRHLLEAQLQFRAAFVQNPERGFLVALGIGIEVIQRPVEPGELRPAEFAVGGLVVFTMAEEEVARGEE